MTDPEILRMEVYGEPHRYTKPDGKCEECEQSMFKGEALIRVNGKWICEECFKAYAEDCFSISEIAEMMGFCVEAL